MEKRGEGCSGIGGGGWAYIRRSKTWAAVSSDSPHLTVRQAGALIVSHSGQARQVILKQSIQRL